MNPAGQHAYLHGKLHGIIAKSFLDERFRFLQRLTNLSEVYRALFPKESLEVSERELVRTIEKKYELQILHSLIRTLDILQPPPDLLLHTLQKYEIRNVKAILRNLPSPVLPSSLWDLGKYATFSIKEANLKEALTVSPYKDVLAQWEHKPLWAVEFSLDERYYLALLKDIEALPRKEREILLESLLAELRWINGVWILRLKYYYRMEEEDIRERLLLKEKVNSEKDLKELLQLSWEDPGSWKGSKYEWLVRVTPEGQIDPAPAPWRLSKYLYRLYRRIFYRNPFTLSAVYGFFRMKEYEIHLIHSLTEGIQLGETESELKELTEGL
ncbi:MAG: V-type ATPase subunit [Spirochaetales bacterium]